jgi:7-cyano-7-deazaguanine synthase
MDFMAQLLDNSALTGDTAVPEGHYADENMKLTVVPNRNMIMASIAIGLAVNNGQEAIAMGVHSGDHAIYPDCRPEFVSALRTTSLIANYEPIDVLAPYLKMDKTSIIARGLEIDTMDYAETWTCYKGLEKACGVCGSCQERLEGFANNDIDDPIKYETRELINGSN